MRQLGEVMDRIAHGEECKLIEPVVPEQPDEFAEINAKWEGINARVPTDFNDPSLELSRGGLVIITKKGEQIVNDVRLIYPETYLNGYTNAMLDLSKPEWYNTIFTTVPLTTEQLLSVRDTFTKEDHTIYANDPWRPAMSLTDKDSTKMTPLYDYDLYVYLFPK